MSLAKLITGLKRRNSSAIARLITIAENHPGKFAALAKQIYRIKKSATVIGVTGAPGAGKSTLVDKLALEFSKKKMKVAILAVDPSSPFSYGAVLGDRFRMQVAAEKNIFIRSFASRGSLGGLTSAIPDSIAILEAAGFDYIIIETVGVGQGEVDIAKVADCTVVVLVPGMGDGVQALKAGILEIADIFAINKSDYSGTEILERELISIYDGAANKLPSLIKTVASKNKGSTELCQAIKNFIRVQKKSLQYKARRQDFFRHSILLKVNQQLISNPKFEKTIELLSLACLNKTLTPIEAARKIRQLL